MDGKINIIYSDLNRGGVFTVSNSLANAFQNNKIKTKTYNIREENLGMFERYLKTLKFFLTNSSKSDVFVLMHFDAIFIGLLLRMLGYKNTINVVHIDLVDYFNSISLIKKTIIKIIFYLIRNKKNVFVSNEAEKKAVELFKLTDTCTIYNIYSPPVISLKKQSNGYLKLGVLSRLHQVKNIDLTMRLIKEVKKHHPYLKLYIYGKGEEEENLKNYINQLGLSDDIIIKGFTSNQEAAFSDFDALISMSSVEGLPTLILESISFKTPVFHTDCSSGPRELMSPNTNPLVKTNNHEKTNIGYLVKPLAKQHPYSETLTEDEVLYVDILLKFIEDLKNSSFNMDYDFTRFSEEVVVAKWLDILNKYELFFQSHD